MKLTQKRSATASRTRQLEQAIESIEKRIAQERDEIRQHEVSIEEAETTKASLADLEVEGEIDVDESLRRADEADAKVRRHQAAIDRLERVLARRGRDLEEFRRELDRARFETAREAWGERCDEANERSKTVALLSKRLAKESQALVAARAATDEAQALAEELCPDGVDLERPSNVDEPDWPDLSGALDVLAAGPRQPHADEKESIARLEAQQRRSDESLIRQAVQQGGSMISRLPERLRDEAGRRRAALMEQEEARAAARAREAEEAAERGSPPDGEKWTRIHA